MPLTQVWRITYQKLLNFLLVTKSGCVSSSNHCLEHQRNLRVITSYLKWKCTISRLFPLYRQSSQCNLIAAEACQWRRLCQLKDFLPTPIKRLVSNPVKKILRKKSNMSSFNSVCCSVFGKPWKCYLSRT